MVTTTEFCAGFGWTADSVVKAVLEEAGKPLHFEEIHRRANLISEKKHEERHLHNAARNVGVLYARGTYGLLSHCPLTQEELALVEAEVEDIASGGEPDKQWHTAELLDELLDRGLDFDGKLTKYVIQIALRRSKTFANMKRMVLGYKDKWDATAASRLDMRQAVMALLEETGRPMNTMEIREGLQNGRGVNNHFQIHPLGNLIRMGTGLWGLADRDIKVDDPDAMLIGSSNTCKRQVKEFMPPKWQLFWVGSVTMTPRLCLASSSVKVCGRTGANTSTLPRGVNLVECGQPLRYTWR